MRRLIHMDGRLARLYVLHVSHRAVANYIPFHACPNEKSQLAQS